MIELVISTSSVALSVALIDGPAIVAEHHVVIGRGHAEAIVTAIADLVGDCRAGVGGIVVDVGPGSFTGVRIGVAAARALGLAWSVPVAGIGSLALVAAAAFAAGAADSVVATTDAGRGRVYWQVFTRCGSHEGAAAVGDTAAVIVPPGAMLAGNGMPSMSGGDRVAAHPRAAAARHLGPAARGAALPLYFGTAAAA